jgi:hypothetical protein
VQSCTSNKGANGVTCGWLTGKSGRCHHPQWRELWAQLTEAQEMEAAPRIPVPRSLAGRVTAASKPMDVARARQLILELEV